MQPIVSSLSEARLREALREALAKRSRHVIERSDATPSAVLIPLVEWDDDVHMWLVRRPDTMRRHSGQVAFPGGRAEASDDSLKTTALREAHEEIGLHHREVDVLGALDDLITGTGYVITPYVAWVGASFEPVPEATEVVRAFRAPLRVFSTPASGTFPRIGHEIGGELVWGATFVIARNLASLVGSLIT